MMRSRKLHVAIANLLGDIVVEVPEEHSIGAMIRWLKVQNLVGGKDYNWSGNVGQKSLFSFKSRTKAMMFKLTWGGK